MVPGEGSLRLDKGGGEAGEGYRSRGGERCLPGQTGVHCSSSLRWFRSLGPSRRPGTPAGGHGSTHCSLQLRRLASVETLREPSAGGGIRAPQHSAPPSSLSVFRRARNGKEGAGGGERCQGSLGSDPKDRKGTQG